jgi:hypothetical protein
MGTPSTKAIKAGSGTAHGPGGVHSTWEFVTWEKAAEYLERNIGNRNIKALNQQRISSEMANDAFVPTHQGIAFDREGILRDGQNRLQAMVDTKTNHWMLVTRGLSPEAQRHMDRNAVRQVSDFMSGSYGAVRVAAGRIVIAVRTLGGVITPSTLGQQLSAITDSELYHLFDYDTDMVALLEKYSKDANKASKFLPVGPSPVLASSVIFPDVAENFLGAITSGVGFNEGNPLLAFRNAALSTYGAANRHTLSQQPMAAYHTIRVFSMVHKQSKVRRLQYDTASEISVPIP